MSTVFGSIAAVLLAIAAFVAFKNKEAYQGEIDINKTALKLQTSTEKELGEEQERLTSAEAEKEEKIATAKVVQGELEEATANFEAAEKSVTTFKSEHAANELEMAAGDETLKELPNPSDLIPKVKRMRTELSAAASEIDSSKATLANLLQRSENAENRIASIRNLIDLQSTGKSFPTLRTKISSVYRNWGFVILSAGDKQGVVSGSNLDVLRGNELIGKLKVTAVESGRASADIILDSVAEGVTLQAGDSVVAERALVEANTSTTATR